MRRYRGGWAGERILEQFGVDEEGASVSVDTFGAEATASRLMVPRRPDPSEQCLSMHDVEQVDVLVLATPYVIAGLSTPSALGCRRDWRQVSKIELPPISPSFS